MSDQTLNLQTRIAALNAVLTENTQQAAVQAALTDAERDWSATLSNLKGKLSPDSLQKVTLAYSLAVLSDKNAPVVKALAEQPGLISFRDVALRNDVEG